MSEKFNDTDDRFFLIFPEEFSEMTWELLKGMRLAELVGTGGRDYQVPTALGLMLMSILADECASETRTRVTDRTYAYSWLMGLMTHDLGGNFLPNVDATQLASTYDRLVNASIRTVNTDGIPLQNLVKLRRREAAGSSTDYRKLRQKYAERTFEYVSRLGDPNLSVADQMEIQRQYTLDMESDLRGLKTELGIAAGKALLLKEMATSVLAVAGAILAPSAMPVFKTLGVGALLKTGLDYVEARRKALEGHVLSSLYLAR